MRAKIKICRIIDLDTAIKLVNQGIDFLGFHIINESDLYLLEEYSKINSYLIHELNFHNSVFLTKINSIQTIESIILKSNFNIFQFHYKIEDEILFSLIKNKKNKKYIFIYDPAMHDRLYYEKIRENSDYIILDNIEGGTGKMISIDNFNLVNSNNIFIAGGINLNNIKILNQKYSPFGFDVQSSTEITKGVKDFDYIKKLQQELL